MIDSAEKVRIIDALKNCLDRPKCRDCPWHECEDVFDDDCVIPRSLAEKALALAEELMTVEPKRGKWKVIFVTADEVPLNECSECGHEIWGVADYCPKCGAKMEVETDA